MFYEHDLSYTQFVNSKIKSEFENYDNSVIYGQNIVAGSRISGLGAGLEKIVGVKAINATNTENSLMGVGFGLAVSGIPSLFLMKQHDFALLGLDQLTNTNNVLRNGKMLAPFRILMVIVDSGFEGPQASLSSLDEFASLTRAPVHFLSTFETIEAGFVSSQEPGLHFMALSQKNMKKKVLKSNLSITKMDSVAIYRAIKRKIHQKRISIVFFGVEISIAQQVTEKLLKHNLEIDLFVITQISNKVYSSEILGELIVYDEIILIDTGKSDIHYSSELALRLVSHGISVSQYCRRASQTWSEVGNDSPEFTPGEIVRSLIAKGVN